MGRNQDLFLQQKCTKHLLSVKCCFRGYSGGMKQSKKFLLTFNLQLGQDQAMNRYTSKI